MIKKSNSFLFGILILIFSIGCSNEEENKKLVEKNSTQINKNSKLIDELKPIANSKIVYSINNKNYEIDALPKNYIELPGKARKFFLDSHIKYSLTLGSLLEEQKKYKKTLDKQIKNELDKIAYRGINQSELDKFLYIQRLKLEKIAIEEVANKEENLTQKIEKVYKRNKDKFKFSNTVELSFILLKDEKKALTLLNKMDVNKTNITEFSSFVKKNSLDAKSRSRNGYAGYMTEESAGAKLFNTIWSHELGLVGEVLEQEDKFLLVFIHKKIKSGERTLSDVYSEIKEKLLLKKRNQWIHRVYQKNIKIKKIIIYDSFEKNQTF